MCSGLNGHLYDDADTALRDACMRFHGPSSCLIAARDMLQTAFAAVLEQMLRRQGRCGCAGVMADRSRVVLMCADILTGRRCAEAACCRIASDERPIVAITYRRGAPCQAVDAASCGIVAGGCGGLQRPRTGRTRCRCWCRQAACSDKEQQNRRQQHPLCRLAVATHEPQSGRLTLRFDTP